MTSTETEAVSKILQRLENINEDITQIKIFMATSEERSKGTAKEHAQMDVRVAHVESQIRQLDSKITYASGVVAVVVGLVTFLSTKIFDLLKGTS